MENSFYVLTFRSTRRDNKIKKYVLSLIPMYVPLIPSFTERISSQKNLDYLFDPSLLFVFLVCKTLFSGSCLSSRRGCTLSAAANRRGISTQLEDLHLSSISLKGGFTVFSSQLMDLKVYLTNNLLQMHYDYEVICTKNKPRTLLNCNYTHKYSFRQ